MRWVKRLKRFVLLLIVSALTGYWSILYIRPYKGLVGNLCEQTAENPHGGCYDMLPSGGFPFTFMWDNGGVSVVGTLSWLEDTFVLGPYLANLGFYLVIYTILLWLFSRLKALINALPQHHKPQPQNRRHSLSEENRWADGYGAEDARYNHAE